MTPQKQEYIFDEDSAHISRNEQDEINADAENLSSLYRLIPLTQGQWTIVDAADYDWLMQWKWHANYNTYTKSYYAGRGTPRCMRDMPRAIWMHREILGLPRKFDGRICDHRDYATLNNRRSNLRIATKAQNNKNQRLRVDNPSGFTGVSLFVRINKWRARISFEGRQIFLGYYTTREEAVEVRRKAAIDLYGEFAPKV
jgi:hypothetical protein